MHFGPDARSRASVLAIPEWPARMAAKFWIVMKGLCPIQWVRHYFFKVFKGILIRGCGGEAFENKVDQSRIGLVVACVCEDNDLMAVDWISDSHHPSFLLLLRRWNRCLSGAGELLYIHNNRWYHSHFLCSPIWQEDEGHCRNLGNCYVSLEISFQSALWSSKRLHIRDVHCSWGVVPLSQGTSRTFGSGCWWVFGR